MEFLNNHFDSIFYLLILLIFIFLSITILFIININANIKDVRIQFESLNKNILDQNSEAKQFIAAIQNAQLMEIQGKNHEAINFYLRAYYLMYNSNNMHKPIKLTTQFRSKLTT